MRLNFDHNFYKKIYPEFKNFTNYNIEKHYKLYGLKEGRMKNLVDFLERYPEFDYIWYKKNIERDTLDCVLYYYKIIKNIKLQNFYIGKPLITFILPTIGREHLLKSVASVYWQTVSNWNLIIIFDGIGSTINNPRLEKDKRINIMKTGPKLGEIKPNHNNAGEVRNRAFPNVSFKSEWVGFIDDDDLLEPNYIESLLWEIEQDSSLELVVFRMRHSRNSNLIVPPLNCNEIIKNKVGISFCFKQNLLDKYNLKFHNNEHEDYLFLIKIIEMGIHYKISEKITYVFK